MTQTSRQRRRLQQQPITDWLQALNVKVIYKLGAHTCVTRAEDINHGYCGLWACLARRLLGGDLYVVEDHAFLRGPDGKWYDAEHTGGLDDPWELLLGYADKNPMLAFAEAVFDGWCEPNLELSGPPYHWLKTIGT